MFALTRDNTLNGPSEKSNSSIDKFFSEIILSIAEPGKFEFTKPSYIVRDSVDTAQVFVKRSNGADGTVSVGWKTQDMTAMTGRDYGGGDGTLTFGHGETSKPINVKLMDTDVRSFSTVYCI